VIDFKNTILIMTTNIGAMDIVGQPTFGFGSARKHNAKAEYQEMKAKVLDKMGQKFKPEFLNRLDDTIVFVRLEKEDLNKIVDIELDKVRKRLANKGLTLVMTAEAKDFLIEKGSSLEFGARPLRRAIEQHLEDPLSEDLLRDKFKGLTSIVVQVAKEGKDSKLVFKGPSADTPEMAGAGVSGEDKG
jgi:ATP-dependent Clp protease ATP-binding subunit ClpC